MELYFGWMGFGGKLCGVLVVGGGEWRYILGGWCWVDIFYGWVGVVVDGWRYIKCSLGWVDSFYG